MKLLSKVVATSLLSFAVCSVHAQEGPPNEDAASKPANPSPAATGANPAVNTSKPGAKNNVRADRLDLETTTVSGNRELPKVLYIVPWKKADLGELPAQPFNTLLDEVLQPVDRDVFKREVKYFQAVSGGINAPKKEAAPAAPATPPVTRY